MERLGNTVQIRGVGKEVTASFVKRRGNICFYQRSDGPYEVFYVKVFPEEVIKNKKYPEREGYPSNEDFGKIAWCFTEYEHALKRFDSLEEDG